MLVKQFAMLIRYMIHFVTLGVTLALVWNTVLPQSMHWFPLEGGQWIGSFAVMLFLWVLEVLLQRNAICHPKCE